MTTPTNLPNSASLLSPPMEVIKDTSRRHRPQPLSSITASAKRITTGKIKGRVSAATRTWQTEAWDLFDLVGEERFLATTLASQASKARLYVGELTDDPTELPNPVDDSSLNEIIEALGSPSQRTQLVNRLGVNLFVAGEGWIVGVPRVDLPRSVQTATSLHVEGPGEQAPTPLSKGRVDRSRGSLRPVPSRDEQPAADTVALTDLEWYAMSTDEVSTDAASGNLVLRFGEGEEDKVETSPDKVILVRVWRPHPKKAWEPDSPTRASLPVLRELVGLTMHISAQVDSRLAGGGLLIVPQGAQRALRAAAGLAEDDESDPFTESLMEAMITPIGDRSSASAVVPLVVTVPDDLTDSFNYITFDKPLDAEARSMRDEAIRRLALGQDAPPELLLGTAGMNHWGAWLVREDVVTTHLEPPLALICDALTTQWLWPVLMDQGYGEEDAKRFVIWYDVSDIVVRPNRSTDAFSLHERGAISDAALRDATGFDESDAPAVAEQSVPVEVQTALDLVRVAPTLMSDPGLPALVAQIRLVLNAPDTIDESMAFPEAASEGEQPGTGTETPDAPESGPEPPPDGSTSVPTTDAEPPTLPGLAAGGLPVGFARQVVVRPGAVTSADGWQR